MKRILSLILACLMVAACLVGCNDTPIAPSESESDTNTPIESTPIESAPDAESESTQGTEPAPTDKVELYVGYGRTDITPTVELLPKLTLAGYAKGREASTIKEKLYASCTAFKDAEGDIALVYSIDLHAISPTSATNIASKITKETGVPKTHIILNVMHNHTAPNLEAEYFNNLVVPAIIEAGVLAIEDLLPCTEIYGGEIDMTGYTFPRRYKYDNEGNRVAFERDPDVMTPLARFVREGGKDVLLFNFASHCDNVGAGGVSGDYVATLRLSLEREMDAYVSVQLGACGDLIVLNRGVPGATQVFKDYRDFGKELHKKIAEELKTLPKLELAGDVRARSTSVRVDVDHSTDDLHVAVIAPYHLYMSSDDTKEAEEQFAALGISSVYEAMYIINRYGLGQYERRNISAVAVGNIVFAAADFEMFSATGRIIKDAGNEEFDLTFMCPYSNGMIGYIPADYAYENGGYEVYSRLYVPGTAEKIAEKLIEVISGLAE